MACYGGFFQWQCTSYYQKLSFWMLPESYFTKCSQLYIAAKLLEVLWSCTMLLVTWPSASSLQQGVTQQRPQEAQAISCPKKADLRAQKLTNLCPRIADLRWFQPQVCPWIVDLRAQPGKIFFEITSISNMEISLLVIKRRNWFFSLHMYLFLGLNLCVEKFTPSIFGESHADPCSKLQIWGPFSQLFADKKWCELPGASQQ